MCSIKQYWIDKKVGSLNYNWNFRSYLSQHIDTGTAETSLMIDYLIQMPYQNFQKLLSWMLEDHQHINTNSSTRAALNSPLCVLLLTAISIESYLYLKHNYYRMDSSLKAVVELCNNYEMLKDLEYWNPELVVLSNLFNRLVGSGRKNLQCYDCGTAARGIFYSLIKQYRSVFYLSKNEIDHIKHQYMRTDLTGMDGLHQFIHTMQVIDQHAICICSMKFGAKKFGHIFVAEKLWINGRPVIRFYQSALNSYLLIDYIMHMKYIEFPEKSINLNEFANDMRILLTVPKWTQTENLLFVKWFCFYPQSKIDDTSVIQINAAFIKL